MGEGRGRSRSGIYAAFTALVVTIGLGIVGAAGADQAAPAHVYAHDESGAPRCFSDDPAQCEAGPPNVEINTGETVTWHFDDGTELHNAASSNAVAADPDWEGYAGAFVSSGSYSRQFTKPGTYEFVCQAHLEMTGTITVTGPPIETATPTPTPTTTPPSSPPPPDTTTPSPTGSNDAVKPAVRRMRPTALRRGVRVRFTLSEPATVTIRVKRARRVVRSARVQAAAGTRTVTLRSRHLKKGRYTVEIVARDSAGNRSSLASKRVTLRR